MEGSECVEGPTCDCPAARRHAANSVKVHLKYGRLTLHDMKKVCDSLEIKQGKRAKCSSHTTKELWAAQREIAEELKRRTGH
mgnify:CR=1 FL=1